MIKNNFPLRTVGWGGACACVHVETEIDVKCLPQLLSPYFLRQGLSLTWLACLDS